MHPCHISIIVPVYNCAAFVRECIQSTLVQTMKEIEVIAVNDGSTDDADTLLNELSLEDNRLKVIHTMNQGVAAARNLGVSYASGDYLLFLDGDDILHPQTCEILHAEALKLGTDVLSFDYGRSLDAFSTEGHCEWASPPDDRADCALRMSVTACTKLWSRSFWNENNIQFPPGIRIGEDQVTHWHALAVAGRVAHVKKCLYYYRPNPHSSTRRGGEAYFDIFIAHARIRDILELVSSDEDLRKRHVSAMLYMFRSLYLRLDKTLREDFLFKIISSTEIGILRSAGQDAKNSFWTRQFYRGLCGDVLSNLLHKFFVGLRDLKTKLC